MSLVKSNTFSVLLFLSNIQFYSCLKVQPPPQCTSPLTSPLFFLIQLLTVSDGKIYFITYKTTSTLNGDIIFSGYSTIYALIAAPQIKSDLAVSCLSSTSYDSFHVTIKGTLTTNGTGSSAVPIQFHTAIAEEQHGRI